MKLEYVIAGLLFLFGFVSAYRSLAQPPLLEKREGGRLLIAVHEAAKALFWLSLGGFFLAYGLAEGPLAVRAARYLVLIPIGMAALRMVAASIIGRT